MKRVRFAIAGMTVFFSILWSSVFAQQEQGNEGDRGPNFVFFLVDDLGWMDIGANGSSFYETPNIDKLAGEEAKRIIEEITAEVEVGKVYEGKVARLMDFGAFVNILPGKDGLVHISQISEEHVDKVSDKLSEGDMVKVKVLEIDRQGRVRLSMKSVD